MRQAGRTVVADGGAAGISRKSGDPVPGVARQIRSSSGTTISALVVSR